MMLQQFAAYVMRGPRQAIMVALILTMIPFMGWAGAAVMALVTLRKGPLQGLQILLWISLPSIVIAFLGYLSPIFYTVLCGSLVVWLFAVLLRATNSWSVVLQTAILLGCIGVIIAHTVMSDISGTWYTFISTHYKDVLLKTFESKLSAHEVNDLMKVMAQFATGTQVVILLYINLFTLGVARWLQALLYNPGGFGKELYNLRVGFAADLSLVLIVAAMVIGYSFALDLLPLLLMLFFTTGLSLIHAVAAISKTAWIWLLSFYGLLVVFLPYVVILVVVLAFVDSLVNFRQKWCVVS